MRERGDIAPIIAEKEKAAIKRGQVKDLAEKVKTASTEKTYELFLSYADVMTDEQKTAFRALLEKKADRAAKRADLPDDELEKIREILPDYQPPTGRRKRTGRKRTDSNLDKLSGL